LWRLEIERGGRLDSWWWSREYCRVPHGPGGL
jgi:hypothetical protein